MTDSDAFGAFIETAYDETLGLLVDTREYINTMPKGKTPDAPEPLGRADTMSAISNLTWRMTEVMSWLMLQKAIIIGEISLEDAKLQSSFHLPDITIEDIGRNGPDADLPVAVRGLIDRSRRIGDRATKLQASITDARAQ